MRIIVITPLISIYMRHNHDDVEENEIKLKHIWRFLMTIMDELAKIEAAQKTPVTATLDASTSAQISTIASTVAAIAAAIPAPIVPTTTTAKITNINVADASVNATGPGLFAPDTFTINDVTVTVNANDSLSTITTNIQAALQAAGHVNASAAATDSPGNFTLTVVDPSVSNGSGFAGPAVAGLTIPAPTFS